MLSQPLIEFTPIREDFLLKKWLTLSGSICIECLRLFPFSCSTFLKSSFCFEQAVGQTHQCQCQCIRVHHTVIPARMGSLENNMRISIFVTELLQYLRNRVSDHHCVQSPDSVVFGCHMAMIQLLSLLLNASVFPRGTRNLTISA